MSALNQWQGLVRQKLFLASRLLSRLEQDQQALEDLALHQAYLQAALALTAAARQTALVYIARSHQLRITELRSADELLQRLSEDNPERAHLSEMMTEPQSWWQKLDSLEMQSNRPAPEKPKDDGSGIIAVSTPQIRLTEEMLDKILKDMKGWFSELCERYGEW